MVFEAVYEVIFDVIFGVVFEKSRNGAGLPVGPDVMGMQTGRIEWDVKDCIQFRQHYMVAIKKKQRGDK